jgi:hypothetical protein
MAKSVFSSKDLAKLSYEFVPVIAHGNTDHPSGDYVIGREKKHMCGIYDVADCKQHEAMVQALSAKQMLKGVSGTPTHIIFDPRDMSEISRAHYMTVGNIEDAIAEAQKKLGKPIRYKDFKKMRETLDDASKQIDEKDFRGALRTLKGFDAEGMKGMEAEAKTLDERIHTAGEEMLAKARELIDAGDADEASKLLREIGRQFSGTEIADKAKELKAEAKKD